MQLIEKSIEYRFGHGRTFPTTKKEILQAQCTQGEVTREQYEQQDIG
jgi:hypothetical protein